jgi:hypothetical protein
MPELVARRAFVVAGFERFAVIAPHGHRSAPETGPTPGPRLSDAALSAQRGVSTKPSSPSLTPPILIRTTYCRYAVIRGLSDDLKPQKVLAGSNFVFILSGIEQAGGVKDRLGDEQINERIHDAYRKSMWLGGFCAVYGLRAVGR